MNIDVSGAVPDVEALGIGLDADGSWDPAASDIVEALGEPFERFLEQTSTEGKPGAAMRYPATDVDGVDQILVLGLGSSPDADALRRAAGVLSRATDKAATVATTLASRPVKGASVAVAEGLTMGAYTFDRYRSDAEQRLTVSVTLVGGESDGAASGVIVADAVNLARDLINTPAVDKAPVDIVALAHRGGDRTRGQGCRP